MLPNKPKSVLKRPSELFEMLFLGSNLAEGVGAVAVLIKVPLGHFNLVKAILVIIQEKTEKLIEIVIDLLVGELSQLPTSLSCHKDDENVVFGARIDKCDWILVVFSAFSYEVDPSFAFSPERILETGIHLILYTISNAHDGFLVGRRQRRVELYQVSLKNPQRQT